MKPVYVRSSGSFLANRRFRFRVVFSFPLSLPLFLITFFAFFLPTICSFLLTVCHLNVSVVVDISFFPVPLYNLPLPFSFIPSLCLHSPFSLSLPLSPSLIPPHSLPLFISRRPIFFSLPLPLIHII